MSAHAKKVEIQTSVSALTDEEFLRHLQKPGLRVVDVYSKFAGHCEPMTAIFKRLKLDFGESVTFVQAMNDNIAALEFFRNQSCPAFLFFFNGVLVKVVRGANAPLIERTIKEQLELEKNGLPHHALPLDDMTRPLAALIKSSESEAAEVSASNTGLSRAPSHAAGIATHTHTHAHAHATEDHTTTVTSESGTLRQLQSMTSFTYLGGDTPVEFTLGIIKPDAMTPSIVGEVLSLLHHHRIEVVEMRKVWLTPEHVKELYREQEGREYFDQLLTYMSSGPILVMELAKDNIIQVWRDIVGPKDPRLAKLDAPKTLRALYGKDNLMNSFHASDGPLTAKRELGLFFNVPTFDEEAPEEEEEPLAAAAEPETVKAEEPVPPVTEAAKPAEPTAPSGDAAPVENAEGEKPVVEGEGEKPAVEGGEGEKPAVEGEGEKPVESEGEKPAVEGEAERPVAEGETVAVEGGDEAGDKPAVEGGEAPASTTEEVKPESEAAVAPAEEAAPVAVVEETSAQAPVEPEPVATPPPSTLLDVTELPLERPEDSKGFNQKTLAIIKPDAVQHVEDIVARIVARGLVVQKREELILPVERAQEIAAGIVGNVEVPEFEEVTKYLMSGPVVCLVLKGEDVIRAWLEMIGPEDPAEAKKKCPMSLRSLFGIDTIRNGLHGSTSLDDALREIQTFFPHYLNKAASLSQMFDSRPGTSLVRSLAASRVSLRASVAAMVQRTLALIKPDAYPAKKEDIVHRIKEAGFNIVAEKEVEMSKEMAQQFYREHEGKGFYEDLTNWMSSAPIYALVLEKDHAITAWRELAGPTNSNKAREEKPDSIRAIYGTDGSQNAVHGSDSPNSAEREIKIIFGDLEPTMTRRHSILRPIAEPIGRQQTLALIKPDAYPAKKEEILFKIKEAGFTIVKEAEVKFDKEKAAEFYKEHVAKGFFEDLTNWMSSAPIYAMILEKESGVSAWRELAGPTNSERAREIAPDSIRAIFGTDGSQNAVHGSDSPASAEREINVVFGASPSAASTSADQAGFQRTLALIKPDVYPTKKDEIMSKIREAGFRVVKEEEVNMSAEMAGEFYKEHEGKQFYEELTSWMSSAPIYAMVLEKEAAVTAWRGLAGPTNSDRARETSPNSIRALFGTDGSKNAVHGSDSPASAAREIKVIFGDSVSPDADPVQRTLALIKPDVYPGKKDEIIAKIKERGFTIVKEAEVQMTKELAGEFYKEHEGKGFYEELTSWMSSAPIYAMVLEKQAAIWAWRDLAGPTNSEKARETSPNSIRALFGTNGSQNAVHGSDSPASAEREIKVIFGTAVSPQPGVSNAGSEVKTPQPPAAKSTSGSKPPSRPISARNTKPSTPKRASSVKAPEDRAVTGAAQPNAGSKMGSKAGSVAALAKSGLGSKTASAAAVDKPTSKVASKAPSKVASKAPSKAASKVASRTMSRSGSNSNIPAEGA
ncbi:Thioredoxin domain-containing protein 3 [Blyttiomyces sp. JEL0837]|nr:Thioredoxin domain-containing protein 3 [Blyttiomyces sp. JEL0837]